MVGVQRVDAVSEQWSWTVTPTEFVVGQTVPWELESSLSVNTPLLMRLANITGGHLFDRYEDIFHVESSILGAVDMWP